MFVIIVDTKTNYWTLYKKFSDPNFELPTFDLDLKTNILNAPLFCFPAKNFYSFNIKALGEV